MDSTRTRLLNEGWTCEGAQWALELITKTAVCELHWSENEQPLWDEKLVVEVADLCLQCRKLPPDLNEPWKRALQRCSSPAQLSALIVESFIDMHCAPMLEYLAENPEDVDDIRATADKILDDIP